LRIYSFTKLEWSGSDLRLGSKRGRLLASIEPDSDYPAMWRVRINGMLTDIVNLIRRSIRLTGAATCWQGPLFA
jgi:hypothetical protein